jgi:hypothetical protein
MTRINDYDNIPNLSVTDSGAEDRFTSSQFHLPAESQSQNKTAAVLDLQKDLVSRGIIPHFELI